VSDVLDRVRLARTVRGAYPHQLSGGMRQRVAIAMALINEPQLVIADEPTTALDVSTQARIMEELAELQRTLGIAMLFISHDLRLVAGIASRVAVMHDGEIVEQGPVRALFQSPANDYTRQLLAAVPTLRPATKVPADPADPADPGEPESGGLVPAAR
jgi:ABC-type dipeptide/oligopeptide/nickel transport system ATPase component